MPAPQISEHWSLESIRRSLKTRVLGRTIHYLDETLSTNATALSLPQEEAPDGTLVLAECQTAGRGRFGRNWYSPPGKNMYCSIVLRPTMDREKVADRLSWLPLAAGLATARAVETVGGLKPSLKWPNDILLGRRKVGGILCESIHGRERSPSIVVGIGLNVNQDTEAFPLEFRREATSLAAEAGHPIDRVQLLCSLLSELEDHWDRLFSEGEKRDSLYQDYRALCSTIGSRVRASLSGGETVEGRGMGIGPDGSLQILPEVSEPKGLGGQYVVVRAADVVHVR